MVRNRTLVSGRFFLIWRVASKLLRPGMPMSISTTSGRTSLALSTASPPLEASPTTSMSASAEISVRIPWRNNVWSSASMIRIFAIMFLPGSLRSSSPRTALRFPIRLYYALSALFASGNVIVFSFPCSSRTFAPAALRRLALTSKRPAQQSHPLPHSRQAEGFALSPTPLPR